MERGTWNAVVEAIRRLRRWSPPRARYSNRDILAILLWAALHDRPVSWACRRANWPPQAWRRRLADQSTVSRRLRDPRLLDDLTALIRRVQRGLPPGHALIVDGKPFVLGHYARDPEAGNGWGAGRYNRGYKLHAVIDTSHRVVDFEVRPMNHAEPTVAREMVDRLDRPGADLLLGDAAYDSNPLHEACAGRGLRLLAPRRRPGTGISKGHRHHPARLEAVRLIEGPNPPAILTQRQTIERFFSRLVVGARLFALPPWVRRLRRVRQWVAAKLLLNAIRIAGLDA